jgi:N-acetylneuraminic acid mutarotase
MKRLFQVVGLAFSLCLCSMADAHFVWLVLQGGKVHVQFSESAEAAEPELLKNVEAAKVHALVSGGRGKSKVVEVPLTLADDSLTGAVDGKASAVVLSHEYGVISRGESTFLLKYLAKQHVSPLPGQWSAVNNVEQLPLEVTPSWSGDVLTLTVTWNGKPAVGVEVTAGGCGLEETLTTSEQGVVQCKPGTDGILSVRAKIVEETAGERNGEKYDSIRTYSTLTLPISRPTVVSLSHHVPALPKGITSFGAAVLGNDLYVYGGHFGEAHHYSEGGQSNEFRRISLTAENSDWELLPSGPKLTGLALVEHGGRLYRVGGFTAKNKDDEDQNLWSQSSFAMFDPKAGSWTDLTPLPEGRSSHDAAVVDGKLYVVGGWNMAGPDNTTWHKTALVCDLTQAELKWSELPSPNFERRAVSVAGCNGKLYVIGGMESSSETTREVSAFDPATQNWTSGPTLHGTGMEGFGTSAFAAGDRLIVTSMSGAVQMLSEDGTSWTVAGQTSEPRFFHRQLTTADGRVLLVGGASMATGKSETLELLQFLTK